MVTVYFSFSIAARMKDSSVDVDFVIDPKHEVLFKFCITVGQLVLLLTYLSLAFSYFSYLFDFVKFAK